VEIGHSGGIAVSTTPTITGRIGATIGIPWATTILAAVTLAGTVHIRLP